MVTFVLARADNGVIGVDGRLPWHVPADLKRFKALTMGRAMVMGRKTFDGFRAPLPGRRHIVLTRSSTWQAQGAEIARTPTEALALASEDAVVIGGAEVFALFEPSCVQLTEIHCSPQGDTIVPPFDAWIETFREDHPVDGDRPAYSFVTLTR